MNRQIQLMGKWLMTSGLWMVVVSGFSQAGKDTARTALTAVIGSYSSGKTIAANLRKLVTQNPVVKVRDARGTEYKVVAFEFTWKKKEESEDIKTGKPKTVYYMVGSDVKSNQLPPEWRQQLSTEVKAGEEVALNNIIYNDPKKKANYKLKGALILQVQ